MISFCQVLIVHIDLNLKHYIERIFILWNQLGEQVGLLDGLIRESAFVLTNLSKIFPIQLIMLTCG